MQQKIITIVQLASAILLITSILLQQRGSGLSETFGGAGGAYSTRRGLEKSLLIATIVLAVVFLLSSVLRIAL